MVELTDITGIGPTTEAKINDAGIGSVEDLANADPTVLNNDSELSESKCTTVVRRAKQETIQSITADDLLEEYEDQEYVSTGIDALDDSLGGGWEPETIGLMYGQSGTGKTQVLFSTMGDASSEGTVIYLMTEIQSKSIADRLRSLSAKVEDLSNIHIYQAYDVDEQYEAYQAINEDFDDIDLFVVDSFTAQFRMTERFDGRENLGDRSAEMGRHLREIGEMGRVFQCPVVMTGQVYESPEMFSGPEDLYGGQKMEHFVSYFVRMSEGEGTLKKSTVENHPGIPETTRKLRIGEESIDGVQE